MIDDICLRSFPTGIKLCGGTGTRNRIDNWATSDIRLLFGFTMKSFTFNFVSQKHRWRRCTLFLVLCLCELGRDCWALLNVVISPFACPYHSFIYEHCYFAALQSFLSTLHCIEIFLSLMLVYLPHFPIIPPNHRLRRVICQTRVGYV